MKNIKEKFLKKLKESHWATWNDFNDKDKQEEYHNLLFDAYKFGEEHKLTEVGKLIDEIKQEDISEVFEWVDVKELKKRLGIK